MGVFVFLSVRKFLLSMFRYLFPVHILLVGCAAQIDSAPPLPPGPPPPHVVQDDESSNLQHELNNLPVPPPNTSYGDHLAQYQELLDKLNWLNTTALEETQLRKGDWTAAFDAEENGWYFFNNVTNTSTWNPPEEFKALYAAHELRNGEDVGRLDGRGTVYFYNYELQSGGNFTQALKDNLKEQKLYNNIVKDFIEAYAIKSLCWLGLNLMLYGGTMFYDGFRRKRRDTNQLRDYLGGVSRALDNSQTWNDLMTQSEEEGRDWQDIVEDTLAELEEDLEKKWITDLDQRRQLEAELAYPIFKSFGIE